MEGVEFNLDFVFNFVKQTSPDVPIQPESAIVETADPLSFLLLAVFMIAIFAGGFFFISRHKARKATMGNHGTSSMTNVAANVASKVFAIIAAIALSAGIFLAITKAFAGNDVPTDQQTINVVVNEDTGEMTFDPYVLTNTESVDVSIAGSQITLAEEFAKDDVYTQSKFEIDGFGGKIYEGNLEGDPYYVYDPNLHPLKPGASENLNFNWTKLSKENIAKLIGKKALTVTLRVKNSKIKPPVVNPLEYNASVQTPFTSLEAGYIVGGTTEGKDAGTYEATATLCPGFEWDSPTPLPQTIIFPWEIAPYNVGKTSTEAYIKFSEINPGAADPYKVVYNGQDHEVSATFVNTFGEEGITAVYNLTKDGHVTTEMINSGTYSLNVTSLTGTGSKNYKLDGETVSQIYTIDKAPSVITAPDDASTESTYDTSASYRNVMPDPKTYSGQIASYTAQGTLPQGFSIQLLGGDYYIECAPSTNVKWENDEIVPYVMPIVVTDTGDENHYSGSATFNYSWKINQADNKIEAPTEGILLNSIYDEYSSTTRTIAEPKNYQGTLSYIKVLGEDYFTVSGANLIAEQATPVKYSSGAIAAYDIEIKAHATGNLNYKEGDVTYTMMWTVNKAESEISDPTTGLNVNSTYNASSTTDNPIAVPQNTHGDVTYTKVSGENYFSISSTNLIAQAATPVKYSVGLITFYEIGITATDTGDGNYNPGSVTYIMKWTVNKAESEISDPTTGLNVNSTYNASSTTDKPIAVPQNTHGTVSYSKTSGENYFSVNGTILVAAQATPVKYLDGEITFYKIEITAQDEGDENYNPGSVTYTMKWIINKAESEILDPATGLDVDSVYNANSTTDKPIAVPQNTHGTVSYSKTSGENYFSVSSTKLIAQAATPVKYNDGLITYYEIGITATDTGDGNYNPGSVTYTMKWTVNKAENPMVVPDKATKEINYETSSSTYKGVTGAIGSVTYSKVSAFNWITSIESFKLTYDFSSEIPAVGTHTLEIQAHDSGDPNYKEATKSFYIDINISKAPNHIVIAESSECSTTYSATSSKSDTFSPATDADGAVTYAINSTDQTITSQFSIPDSSKAEIFVAPLTPANYYEFDVIAHASGDAKHLPADKTTKIKFTVNEKLNPQLNFLSEQTIAEAQTWNPNNPLEFIYIGASSAVSEGAITYELLTENPNISANPNSSKFSTTVDFLPGECTIQIKAKIEETETYASDEKTSSITFTVNKASSQITFNDTTATLDLPKIQDTQKVLEFNAASVPSLKGTTEFTYEKFGEWKTYATIASASENKITFTYSTAADADYENEITYAVTAKATNAYYTFENVSANVKVTLKDPIRAKAVMDHSSSIKAEWSMTFYYDYVDHSGTNIDQYIIDKNVDFDITKGEEEGTIPAWDKFYFDSASGKYWPTPNLENNVEPSKIVFDSSFANFKKLPSQENFTSIAYWFNDMTQLNSVSGMEYITGEISNTTSLFSNLKDSSKSISSLDISKLNTSKVTDAASMFQGCVNLTNLDLTKNNFSNLKNVQGMFEGTAITAINLTTIPTNLHNTERMFYNCRNLKTIYNINNFSLDSELGASSTDMFKGCTSLMGGNGFKYNEACGDINYAKVDMLASTTDTNKGYFTYCGTDTCTLTYVFDENTSQTTKDLYANYSQTIKQGTYFTAQGVTKMQNPEYKDETQVFKEWTDGQTTYKTGKPVQAAGTSMTLTVTWKDPKPLIAKALAYNATEILVDTPTIVEELKFVYDDKTYTEGEDGLYKVYNITENTCFDIDKIESDEMTIAPWQYIDEDDTSFIPVFPEVYPEKITIDESFTNCEELTDPDTEQSIDFTSIAGWFLNMPGPIFNGLENFKPEILEDASFAFSCVSLDIDNSENTLLSQKFNTGGNYLEIDLSKFDQPNITKVMGMFQSCLANKIILPQNFAEQAKIFGEFIDAYALDTVSLFYKCKNLYSISVSNALNKQTGYTIGKNVEQYDSTFSWCSNLRNLELDKFNFYNAVSVERLFEGCALDSISLPISFKEHSTTNLLKNTMDMFSNCDYLRIIDIQNLKTAYVEDMSFMFWSCRSLTTINFPECFTTSNVQLMSYMFSYCSTLQKIIVNSYWDLSKVKDTASGGDNGNGMFEGCGLLFGNDFTCIANAEERGVASENVENATMAVIDTYNDATTPVPGYFSTNKEDHFYWGLTGGSAYKTLSISPYRIDGVCDNKQDELLNGIQDGLVAPWNEDLENILIISIYGTSEYKIKMANAQNLFRGLTKVESIAGLEYLDLTNAISTSGMFYQLGKDTEFGANVDLNYLSTSNTLTSTRAMFAESNIYSYWYYSEDKQYQISLNNMDTSNVVDMAYMFKDCSAHEVYLTNFSSNSITDASQVEHMFSGCNKLTSIYVPENFDLSNLNPAATMFENCSENLVGQNNTHWTEENISSAFAKCDGGELAPGYFSKSITCYWGFHENTLYLSANKVEGKAEIEDNTILSGFYERWLPWENYLYDINKVKILGNNKIKLTSAYELFRGLCYCQSIEGLEYLDLTNVYSTYGMFVRLGSNLVDYTQIDLTKLKTSEALINTGFMFMEANVEIINLEQMNAVNVNRMDSMFEECKATIIDISSLSGYSPDCWCMFYRCSNLTTIIASEWFTPGSSSALMFSDCEKLVGGAGTKWSSDHISGDYAHIDGGLNNPGYFTRSNKSTGKAVLYKDADGNDTELKFVYDNNIYEPAEVGQPGVKDLFPIKHTSFFEENYPSWEDRCNPEKVIIDESFKNFKKYDFPFDPHMGEDFTSMDMWFWCFDNLTEITGLKNINSSVESMCGTFAYSFPENSEAVIDLTYFDQPNLKYVTECFSYSFVSSIIVPDGFAPKATVLNFPGQGYGSLFTDSHASNIKINGSIGDVSASSVSAALLFAYCENLTSLDLSNMPTKNFTDMSLMFHWCENLQCINLSSFNTSNVKYMREMFSDCPKLNFVYVGDEWDTTKVMTEDVGDFGENMFYGCENITGGCHTNQYNYAQRGILEDDMNNATAAVIDTYGLPDGKPGYLTHYTNIHHAYWGVKGTGEDTTLYLSASYVQDKADTLDDSILQGFQFGEGIWLIAPPWADDCDKIKNIEILHNSNQKIFMLDGTYFFACLKSAKSLTGLENIDFTGVHIMEGIFFQFGSSYNTPVSIDLSNLETSNNLINFNDAFCDSNIQNINLDKLNTSNVSDFSFVFSECSALTIDISSFSSEKVNNCYKMFSDCQNLTTITANPFFNLTHFQSVDIFYGSTNLKGDKGTHYTEDAYSSAYAKLDGGLDSPGYFSSDKKTYAKAVLHKDEDGLDTYMDFVYDNQLYDVAPEGTAGVKKVYPIIHTNFVHHAFPYFDLLPAWTFDELSITKVNFTESFKNFTTYDCPWDVYKGQAFNSLDFFFAMLINLEEINGLENIYDGIESAKGTFLYTFEYEDPSVLDLSNFKQTKLENVFDCFCGCMANTIILPDNFAPKATVLGDMYYDNDEALSRPVSIFDKCVAENIIIPGTIGDVNASSLDASYLFFECDNLKVLEMPNINSHNWTSTKGMFSYCKSLENLNLSMFNTQNVLEMKEMFYFCNSLKNIYVSDSWNHEKVISEGDNGLNMFAGCDKLRGEEYTRISNAVSRGANPDEILNAAMAVIDQYYHDGSIGYLCSDSNLPTSAYWGIGKTADDNKTLYLSPYYVPNKAYNLDYSILNGYEDSAQPWKDYFNTIKNVKILGKDNYKLQFTSCKRLFKDLIYCANIEGFENMDLLDTGDTIEMFMNLGSANNVPANIDFSKIKTTGVLKNINKMFYDVNTSNIVLTSMDVNRVNQFTSMFENCKAHTINISSFDTSRVDEGKLDYMFANCNNLTTIFAGYKFDASKAPSENMFDGCTEALTGGKNTHWETGKTSSDYAKIDEGPESPGYFTLYYITGKSKAVLYKDTDGNDTSLNFVYDENEYIPAPEGQAGVKAVFPIIYTNAKLGIAPLWYEVCNPVSINFDESFKDFTTYDSPTDPYCGQPFNSLDWWFSYMDSVKEIWGFGNIHNGIKTANFTFYETSNEVIKSTLDLTNFRQTDLSEVYWCFGYSEFENIILPENFAPKATSLYSYDYDSGLFEGCNATNIIVPGNIGDVNASAIDASYMFCNCDNLESIDLSNMNTSNYVSLGSMFSGCEKIKSINFSNWDTRKVKDMNDMFGECYELKILDISMFDTKNVTKMGEMFWNCKQLETIFVGNNWSTKAVMSPSGDKGNNMFRYCNKLNGQKGTNLENAVDRGVSSDHKIDATMAVIDTYENGTGSPGYLSSGKDAPHAYWGFNESDKTLYLSPTYAEDKATTWGDNMLYGYEWYYDEDTGDERTTAPWFEYANEIENVNILSANSEKLTPYSTSYYFGLLKNIKSIDGLENLNMFNVEQSIGMFYKTSSNLTENPIDINLEPLKTSYKLTDTGSMFQEANFKNITLSNFNTSEVLFFENMFFGCNASVIDIRSFSCEKVSMVTNMFSNCKELTKIIVKANFDLSLKGEEVVFANCSDKLIGGKNSRWNEERTTAYFAKPDGGESDPGLFTVEQNQKTGKAVYVKESDTCNTLKFVYDSNVYTPGVDNVLNVFPITYTSRFEYIFPYWYGSEINPNKIEITESFKDYETYDCPADAFYGQAFTSMDLWFADFRNLTNITGLENIYDGIETCNYMFWASFPENFEGDIDLSSFNQSHLKQAFMFVGVVRCKNLIIPNGFLPEATQFWGVFGDEIYTPFIRLRTTKLKLNGSIGNVKANSIDASYLFTDCDAEEIDISKLNTSNFTNMKGMFCECNLLLNIVFSDDFNTQNVTDMSRMFEGCYSIHANPLNYFITSANFDTSNVIDMSSMFRNCAHVTSLDLSKFITSNTLNMSRMFESCNKLTTIYIGPNWSTTAVMSDGDKGEQMFYNCIKLNGCQNTTLENAESRGVDPLHIEDATMAIIDNGGMPYGTPGYMTPSPSQTHPGDQFAFLGNALEIIRNFSSFCVSLITHLVQ